MSSVRLHGVSAEYAEADELLAAVMKAREHGFKHMDAYSPMPIHGLAEAMEAEDNRVPWIIFIGGVGGALAGFGLQYWVSAMAYAHNVGGRPNFSWPSFIPVTFETTVLFAAFGAVFGMLLLNGFPRPHHPIFGVRHFERASTDRFFLCLEAHDAAFDAKAAADFLRTTGPIAVREVAE